MNEALANSKTTTAAGNGEFGSTRLDAGRVASGSSLGDEPEGLRAAAAKEKGKGAPRADREDKDYVIDAVAKALKVFEALEGRSFEPVSVARVAQRTGFGRDFCFRALKTLKVAGYAKETLDGWVLGPKAEALSRKLSSTLLSGR